MKNKEELLKDFIKSNKQRREVLAVRAGFKCVSAYEAYLRDKQVDYDTFKNLSRAEQLKITVEQGYSAIAGYMSKLRGESLKSHIKESKVKPVSPSTIYNIHILDKSGSMGGPKLDTAVEGIRDEVKELKKDSLNNSIKIGIVSFGDRIENLKISDLNNVQIPNTSILGLTALNDAIGITLTSLLSVIKDNEKAIVKVFTDGGENASRQFNSYKVTELINEAESKGVTVAFVGTKEDVERAKTLYSLREGNTLIHDNTAEGVKMSYRAMNVATTSYSKSVASGQSVTTGFFSKELIK